MQYCVVYENALVTVEVIFCMLSCTCCEVSSVFRCRPSGVEVGLGIYSTPLCISICVCVYLLVLRCGYSGWKSDAVSLSLYMFRCWSSGVGRAGGGQMVSLGDDCSHVGTALHETAHALGFWHEQVS